MNRLLFIFLSALCIQAKAQFPVTVHVVGKIILSDSSNDFTGVKIFNKRMDDFVKPNRDGTFELYGFKADTFVFISQGYSFQELSYKDSVRRPNYEAHIRLHRPLINLKEVVIVPEKTIDQIQNEIDNLGVHNVDTYQSVDAYSDPIDALWEMFSRKEKEKRQVAQLMDDDMRRKVMRELLRICIRDHLISLQPSQVDSFIDYCGYTDGYLHNATMYELLSNIKVNYHYFAGK